ncbi:MAG TPA: prepilin-type N-terminal cleavage/methylation domain-containing protein [bacterium]
MNPRAAFLDRRGLTLIELILTLSILAVAGVIISGALATSLGAWRSGFTRGREEVVARVVAERIAAQLRAAVPSPTSKEGQDAIAFDAGDRALRFVTCAAAGAAPLQVAYSLEEGEAGPQLVYREYPWPDKDFFKDHKARREETIPDVTGFSVSVVKRPEVEPDESVPGTPPPPADEPSQKWSPLDELLPKSVTVEFALGGAAGAEAQSYRVEVALPSPVQP